jgi:Flp pilus assembly protein TadD
LLDTAVALGPNSPDAHNNLGIVLAQLGLRAQAQQAFERALRLDARHEDARRNLAVLAARP